MPAIIYPNKLADNVHNSILRNPPFCFFASLLILPSIPSYNSSESSRDLTIFKIPSISLFDITSVILWPDLQFFLCIPASAADTAAVNHSGTKTLLAIG